MKKYLVIALFTLTIFGSLASTLKAAGGGADMVGAGADIANSIDSISSGASSAPGVPTADIGLRLMNLVKGIGEGILSYMESIGKAIWKGALRNYVNNLAYQAAVYTASGITGQKPAFEHRTVGQILVDEADIAVGDALDKMFVSLGNNNFCNLDPKVAINLSAAALIKLRPTGLTPGGRCSASQAGQRLLDNLDGQKLININANFSKDNISVVPISLEDTELQKTSRQLEQIRAELEQLSEMSIKAGSPEDQRKRELTSMQIVLEQKAAYLGPIVEGQRRSAANLSNDVVLNAFVRNLQDNPLMDAMAFQQNISTASTEAQARATVNIQSGLLGQILPPTTTVLGFSKTPVSITTDLVKQQLAKAGLPETTFTGDLLADATDTFLNTLAQKLLQKLLFQGLMNPPEPTQSGFYAGGGSTFGRTQAREALADFIAPTFITNQSLSPLGELSACPDPSKPGLENCVIDANFRQAIEQGLTVRQALAKGYLKADATFGYGAGAANINFMQGYSYRSLVVLRKYRVLPIGWELAAQWLGDSGFNTEGKAFTLQQVINGFNDKNSAFYQLVDPDWVLVIPEAACFKKGPGSEILARTPVQVGTDVNGAIFKDVIQRGDYCADVRTCLQKRDDGSCKAYGYCLEEEEIYKPTGTACSPAATSCSVFTKVSDDSKIALLARTLDGAKVCTAQDTGCRWFSKDKNQDSSWNGEAKSRIFFNNKLETCPAEQDGCSLYYNFPSVFDVAASSNAVANGSFEYDAKAKGRPDGWGLTGKAVYSAPAWHGARALSFQADGSVVAETAPLAQGTWTASVWCQNGCTLDFNGDTSQTSGNTWTQAKVTTNVLDGQKVSFKVYTKKDSLVDGAMVVAGGAAFTSFKEYGEVGADKLFLNKTSAPEACNATTVGTKMFIDNATGLKFAGRVDENSFCPVACVGYTQWNQEPFGPAEKATTKAFIQSEAKMCQASSVGCEGFINVEAKAQAGENIQYFAQYQQCLPWDEAKEARGTYYSWVGSDKAGFELRAFYFEKGGDGWPILAEKNAGGVTDIYCSADDPNPDCLKLYKQGDPENGEIVNISLAKEVSKDCRRFKKQSDGGELAINPNRALSCSAAEVGCRRFTGKRAALSKVIYRQDFESQAVPKDWNIKQDARLLISNNASQFLKHSLNILKDGSQPIVYATLTQKVLAGHSYQIQIWGKSGTVEMYFTDNISTNEPKSEKVTLNFKDDWDSQNAYFDEIKADSENLVVELAGEKVYFDALALRESQDEFYAVKDSWLIRQECFDATKGGSLTCSSYTGEDGQKITATSLVPSNPAAIGCRAVVQTNNSPYPNGATIDDADKNGNVQNPNVKTVLPEHKTVYRVVTQSTQCSAEFQGCRALGSPNYDSQGNIIKDSFATVFAKDNPFNYGTTMCSSSSANMCEAYTANDGSKTKSVYFKDPGAKKCEYLESQSGRAAGWYLAGSDGKNKCVLNDAGGTELKVKTSCSYYFPPNDKSNIKEGWYRPDGTSCNFITRHVDNALTKCSYKQITPTAFNLFGRVAQAQTTTPVAGQINVVDSSAANLNPECLPTEAEANSDPLGVLPYDASHSLSKQNGENDGLVGACNEQFDTCSQYLDPEPSKIDFVFGVKGARQTPFVSGSGRAFYALSKTVDAQSCNGQVNRVQGCRLFEQVGQAKTFQAAASYNVINNTYKAQPNIKDGAPMTAGAFNDSNVLLSVKKERQCSSWLSCKSAILDTNEKGQTQNICLAVGACNQLSDSGEACLGPVSPLSLPSAATSGLTRDNYRNMSGYGQYRWSAATDSNNLQVIEGPVDFASVDQVGKIAVIQNGNFEDSPKDNGEPAHWQIVGTVSDSITEQEIAAKSELLAGVASVRTIANQPSSAKIYEGNQSVKVTQTDFADTGSQIASLENISLASSPFVVSTKSTYVISAKVLVQNLEHPSASSASGGKSSGFVGMEVFCKDSSNNYFKQNQKNSVANGSSNKKSNEAEPTLGKWQTILYKFTTGNQTNACRVLIGFIGSSQNVKGSFYVDDVDVKPVLEIYSKDPDKAFKDNGEIVNPMSQIARSCRIYPTSGAVSCISSEAGKVVFGQEGYCYTPDPGDITRCLQWWPLDVLQGEAMRNRLDQFTPYKGPKPLYMCVLGRGNAEKNFTMHFVSQNVNMDDVVQSFKNGGQDIRLTNTVNIKNYQAKFIDIYTHWYDNSNKDARNKGHFNAVFKYIINEGLNDANKAIRLEDINFLKFEISNSNFGSKTVVLTGQKGIEKEWMQNFDHDVLERAYSLKDGPDTKWIYCAGGVSSLADDVLESHHGCWHDDLYSSARQNRGEVVAIEAIFNETKGLREINFLTIDGSPENTESFFIKGYVGLKEYCLAFSEVVDDSGNTVPWAQRFTKRDGWYYPNVISAANRKNYEATPFGSATFTANKDELKQVVPISATDDPGGVSANLFGGVNNTILYAGVPLACEGVCGEVGTVDKVASSNPRAAERPAVAKGTCAGSGRACSRNNDCSLPSFSLQGQGDIASEICYGVPVDTLPDNLDPANKEAMINKPRAEAFKPLDFSTSFTPRNGSLVLGSMFPVAFKAYCWANGSYSQENCKSNYGLIDSNNIANKNVSLSTQETPFNATNMIHRIPADPNKGPSNFRPSISNVRITCRGDKSLQLDFSANANPEQLPIAGLKIDWGDGKAVDYVSNLTLDSQRIKLFHTYDNDKDMASALGGNGAQNSTIKVGVQDNWGWCSTTPSNTADDQYKAWPNSCLDGTNQTKLSEINVAVDQCK